MSAKEPSYSHGANSNPRSQGRNLPAGAIKAHEIRRQVEEWEDPYLRDEEQPGSPSLCTECGAVWANHRWYNPDEAPVPPQERGMLPKVLCPADRRKRDQFPGGVLTVGGQFFHTHRQTIEDLIRNEEERARKVNTMERVIKWDSEGETLTIETTTPKLAQRIGHALEKAYHGDIIYKWSDNNRLARIDWSREQ